MNSALLLLLIFDTGTVYDREVTYLDGVAGIQPAFSGVCGVEY